MGTGDVQGFSLGEISIGDRHMRVAIADTSELRRRGLMEVEDLGDLDGMLFIMDDTVTNAFTMRNTLIPLHIAFFDEGGSLVDLLEMEPCRAEPCPRYEPAGSYRFAVEVALGEFEQLSSADALLIKP